MNLQNTVLHPRRTALCNVNLSNLENVSERNLRTDRVGDCIFRASESTNFENFSARCQHGMYQSVQKNSGYVTANLCQHPGYHQGLLRWFFQLS